MKTLVRLGGCPGLTESSLGAHAILLFFSLGGSDKKVCQCWESRVMLLKSHFSRF